jgi:hypothetical protein
MANVVRIYGSARNIRETPPRVGDPNVEAWVANSPTTMRLRCPRSLTDWTRWFNLHSKQHILGTYPSGWHYYKHQAAGRPVYLQKADPDIPSSVAFPREAIQAYFATANGPNRYFTCSVCWLIALAVFEGFPRIELWGFELRDTKPGSAYAYERPCFAYWVQQAIDHGVDVVYQAEIARLKENGLLVPGDPDAYTGPLYGYSTKPEPDWDPVRETFQDMQETA